MPWQQLSCALPDKAAESVSEFLESLGALAVTLSELGNEALLEPAPGETPLWKQTRLTALFDMEVNLGEIRVLLEKHFPATLTDFSREILQDQPWERSWLEYFRPLSFGRLWICPANQPPPSPEGVHLVLDPGLAFGTGTHPTTALCLEWLAQQDLQHLTLVDYGCGSGILAVAALLLGARQAVAVDIDPQALTATKENADKNRVAKQLICCYPQDMPDLTVDVVVANILATPLMELAPKLTKTLSRGGKLALSGIMENQMADIQRVYSGQIQFEAPIFREGWVLLTGKRIC